MVMVLGVLGCAGRAGTAAASTPGPGLIATALVRPGAGEVAAKAALALPAAWTLDLADVAVEPAPLALRNTLGTPPQLFEAPEAIRVGRHWRDGRYERARTEAEELWLRWQPVPATSSTPSATDRLHMAMLLVALRLRAGDHAGAAQLARYAASHPTFGLHALRLVVGEAADAGRDDVVLALTATFSDPGLVIERVGALRRLGRLDEAARLLTTQALPPGTLRWRRWAAEAVRLSQARGQEDAAVSYARDLIRRVPKTAECEQAVRMILGTKGGADDWRARLTTRPGDAAAVLDALIYSTERRRYKRTVPDLLELGQRAGVEAAVRCHASSWAARAMDRRGRFTESVEVYAKITADGCAGNDAVLAMPVAIGGLDSATFAFRRGRALALLGRAEGLPMLLAALDAGVAEPNRSAAATLVAFAKRDRNGLAKLATHALKAARDYAEDDVIDVALWQVALDHLIARRWNEALWFLDRLVSDRDDADPHGRAYGYDDRDWSRGRADYFAGRALWETGRKRKALKRWRRVFVRHPLTWYAGMSLARLRLHGGAAAEKPVAAELARHRSVRAGPAPTAALIGGQGVQRARLLGALGWHTAARDELESAGLFDDRSAAATWSDGDPGLLWTRAALDDEAGRWPASHNVGRDALRLFATEYPHEHNRKAWEIAYPRGYRALLEAAATEFHLDAATVFAICRSESGFSYTVESFANAIGLLQLILPTAKAMAKPLGLVATAETLRQPPVNVRLGARYLARLLGRFERRAQMAAGYNAGGGAVGRWRRQRGDWPMDLFVETIPFRETRDYTKRVLGAYMAYRVLYDGAAPIALPLDQKRAAAGSKGGGSVRKPSGASKAVSPKRTRRRPTPKVRAKPAKRAGPGR